MKMSTTFETDRASRHLASLCHHFGRKVDADCHAFAGWIRFRTGRCDMTADDSNLTLIASADDQASLDQVMKIMTSHLERFAFRENPALTWQTHAT